MYIEHQGKQYRYDEETKKLYLQEYSVLNAIGLVVLIGTIFLIAYDFIKDSMRSVSSYRYFYKGRSSEGLQKAFGFTKGNIIREIVKIISFILSIILLSINSEKEISPIPEEIKARI